MSVERTGGMTVEKTRRIDRALARRVQILEGKVTSIESTLLTVEADTRKVKADTAQILDVLVTAKTLTGFFQKHGPRILAFGVGVAIAGGWISAETGRSIGVLFGV